MLNSNFWASVFRLFLVIINSDRGNHRRYIRNYPALFVRSNIRIFGVLTQDDDFIYLNVYNIFLSNSKEFHTSQNLVNVLNNVIQFNF